MNGDIHEKIRTVNVWWEQIRLNVPVYLVKGASNALIDAGPPQQSPAVITDALAPFGVKPADIEMLLLTHGHADHVGGIPHLKSGDRPRIYIHQEDAFLISDHPRAFDEFYGVGMKILSGKEDLSAEKAGFLEGLGPEYDADRLLTEGDVIDLGEGVSFKVVGLPGHTAGSVGYYWEAEGIMIAGDAIPALGSPDGSLPILMDLEAYVASIDKLAAMAVQTLVFTHGYRGLNLAPSTTRRGKEISEYLGDAKEMAQKLIAAIKQEQGTGAGSPFVERVDRIIAAMPPEMKFLPLARQYSQQFTVSTIYWGLNSL